jgi:hypothetical protein
MIAVEEEETRKQLRIPMHKALKSIHPAQHTWRSLDDRRFQDNREKEMDREIFAGRRAQRCVFHGLKKSSVVALWEAGCIDAGVSAITDQSGEMVEHYARAVNQNKLAAAAIPKWEAAAGRRR